MFRLLYPVKKKDRNHNKRVLAVVGRFVGYLEIKRYVLHIRTAKQG